MLIWLGHPYFTGSVAVVAIYLAEKSDGSTVQANIALVLGVIAAAGTLYGIFDRERIYRQSARKRRRR